MVWCALLCWMPVLAEWAGWMDGAGPASRWIDQGSSTQSAVSSEQDDCNVIKWSGWSRGKLRIKIINHLKLFIVLDTSKAKEGHSLASSSRAAGQTKQARKWRILVMNMNEWIAGYSIASNINNMGIVIVIIVILSRGWKEQERNRSWWKTWR